MSLPVTDQIMAVVLDYNERGEPICLKELAAVVDAAMPTVHKRVNELIQDGLLLELHQQTEHGTRKNLYVTDLNRSRNEQLTIQMLGRICYQLERLADATESQTMTAVQRGGRRHHNNQMRQKTLDVRE